MTRCAIILSLLLLVSSCAPADPGNNYTASPEIEPYLLSFQDDARTHGVLITFHGIDVKFGNLPAPTVGICYPGQLRVVVDERVWDTYDSYRREVVIYHELGHCLLGKGHVDPSTPAIMNPMLMLSSYYAAHRIELLNEFFN